MAITLMVRQPPVPNQDARPKDEDIQPRLKTSQYADKRIPCGSASKSLGGYFVRYAHYQPPDVAHPARMAN